MGNRFRRHVIFGALVGLAVFIVMYFLPGDLAPEVDWRALATTIAWDAAALTFLIPTWRHIWPMDAARTRATVGTEAPTRTTTDLVVLTAAVLSLVTVFVVLFRTNTIGGVAIEVRAVLAILAVVLGWCVVHTVYTLKYARLYYGDPQGGIDFNSPDDPAYCDFAYVAFGIGMAFQVADTNVATSVIRKTVLAHALLSFLFATTIVAATINLVAGLKA
jgi:uncharacterized membrane protein